MNAAAAAADDDADALGQGPDCGECGLESGGVVSRLTDGKEGNREAGTNLGQDDEEDRDFPNSARRDGGGTTDKGDGKDELDDPEGELAHPHALGGDVGRGRFDCVRHLVGWTVLKLGGKLAVAAVGLVELPSE